MLTGAYSITHPRTRIRVFASAEGLMKSFRKPALVFFFVLLGIWFGPTLIAQERLPYQDPRLPVEQRVIDLLKRMTLEEKIAQLEGAWENRDNVKDPKALFVDEKGSFLPAQASVLLKNGLGEMSRPSEKRGPREMADFTNTLQKWMKDNT